jgi:hypothetical protein
MPSPLPAHVQMALDEVLLDTLIAGQRGCTLSLVELLRSVQAHDHCVLGVG